MFSNARYMQRQLDALKATTREQRADILDRVKSTVRKDPMASALLDMALADKVRINFESKVDLLPEGAGARYLENDAGIEITLSVLLPKEDLAHVLVHELRHYWQYKIIGGYKKYVEQLDANPRLFLAFKRVIEADAHSFQERFKGLMAGTWEDDSLSAYKEVFDSFLKGADDEEILKRHDVLHTEKACRMSQTLSEVFNSKSTFTLEEVLKLWTGGMDAARLRNVLRFGVEENSPRYDDTSMSDGMFVNSILSTAERSCAATVNILEQFNRLVVAGKNTEADLLIPSIEKEMTAALNSI